MIASEYDELDRELGSLDREAGPASAGLRILPIVIAVVALIAIVGIVWYAYSQGVREGSETAAPLLRPDGPAKAQPDDPGGREVLGSDSDAYRVIEGGDRVREVGVEQILPPPEEPLAPPSEPVAPEAPATAQAFDPDPEVMAQEQLREPIPEPDLPDPTLAAPEAPPPTVAGTTEQVAAAPAEEPAAPAQPAAPAAEEVIAAPEEPAAPEAPAAVSVPQQTASAAGTGWRIQIAALRTRAAAESEWAQRQAALPQLLGGLALGIQEVEVNGNTFFRVRGGPLSDGDAAKALCEQVKAQGLDCIPVAPDS